MVSFIYHLLSLLLVLQSARSLFAPGPNAVITLKRNIIQSEVLIEHFRVSDSAHLEAVAQELRLLLATAAGREDWNPGSTMGVQVVNLPVANFLDRVKAALCHE